jgi:hypothetical protein
MEHRAVAMVTNMARAFRIARQETLLPIGSLLKINKFDVYSSDINYY